MDQCVSTGETAFSNQVGPLFRDGVKSLDRFVEMLEQDSVNSHISAAEAEKIAAKLHPHVTQAYNKFSAAHTKSVEVNTRMYHEVEAGVDEEHKLQSEIRKTEQEERNLHYGYVQLEPAS